MSTGSDQDAEESTEPEPSVCPGCYAVGEEPCLPDCFHAEIAEDRERYEPCDYCLQPESEGCADWCLDTRSESIQFPPLPIELIVRDPVDLAPRIAALEAELVREGSYLGAYSCRWCRELVLDDFDHDFCEPDEPTLRVAVPSWKRTSN